MFRIVVADDEKAEREMLSQYLKQSFGVQVDLRVVENGRQAATMAIIAEADIVLLDIEMPGISGLEAAKLILEQKKDVKIDAEAISNKAQRHSCQNQNQGR